MCSELVKGSVWKADGVLLLGGSSPLITAKNIFNISFILVKLNIIVNKKDLELGNINDRLG